MHLFRSKAFAKNKADFHKQLKSSHVSWYSTGSHLMFYFEQLAKDMIVIVVDAMIYREFISYATALQLAGARYDQLNQFTSQFNLVMGATLMAGLIIWSVHYILHNTLHYPKYVYLSDIKRKHDTKVMQRVDEIEDQGETRRKKAIKARKHRRAMRKLKKK